MKPYRYALRLFALIAGFGLLALSAPAHAGGATLCRDVQNFSIGGVTIRSSSGCTPLTPYHRVNQGNGNTHIYRVGEGITIIDTPRRGNPPAVIVRDGIRYIPQDQVKHYLPKKSGTYRIYRNGRAYRDGDDGRKHYHYYPYDRDRGRD